MLPRTLQALVLLVAVLLAVARPVAAAPDSPAFSDLAGHWAAATVARAAAAGLVSGYPDGSFRPGQPVTRAEFIKLAFAGRGLLPVPGDAGLADARGHWVVDYLPAAVAAGLIVPADYGDPPRLEPDRAISRLEAAVIAARFLHKQGAAQALRGAPLPYSDAIPGWASGAVAVARSTGALSGYPDGSFGPERGLTRAEAAAVVLRLVLTAAAGGTLTPPAALPSPSPRPVPVWEANSWQVSSPPAPAVGPGGRSALAAGPDGSLYVGGGGAVWRLPPAGEPEPVYRSDEPAAGSDGFIPLAVADDGALFLGRGSQILRIAGGGTTVWAGSGESFVADGPGPRAGFGEVRGLCAGDGGNLYVLDGGGAGPLVRKLDAAGQVTTLAGLTPLAYDDRLLQLNGSAFSEGPGHLAVLPWDSTAIACDAAGHVYLGGTGIVRIGPDGAVSWLAGNRSLAGYADGLAAEAQFRGITALAADAWGNLWIADGPNQRLRRLTPDGHVYTVAGGGLAGDPLPNGAVSGYAAADRDGAGPAARFSYPSGLALVDGRLYVAQGSGALRLVAGAAARYPAGVVAAPVPGPGLAPARFPSDEAAPGPLTVALALYAPVARVNLAVDGAPVAAGGDPAYTLGWDATAAAAGTHALLVRAEVPGAGWQDGAELSLQLTPGYQPPRPDLSRHCPVACPPLPSPPLRPSHPALLAPGQAAWLQGTVQLTAAGDGTPLQVRIDGSTVAAGSGRLLTAAWDTTAVADGSHLVELGYFDTAQQAMTFEAITVYVINGAVPAPTDNSALLRVYLKGAWHRYANVQPRLIEGVPFLPFTETMEAFGFRVQWDPGSHDLTVYPRDGWDAVLVLHGDTVTGPGGSFRLAPPPVSVHNNVLVPWTLFGLVPLVLVTALAEVAVRLDVTQDRPFNSVGPPDYTVGPLFLSGAAAVGQVEQRLQVSGVPPAHGDLGPVAVLQPQQEGAVEHRYHLPDLRRVDDETAVAAEEAGRRQPRRQVGDGVAPRQLLVPRADPHQVALGFDVDNLRQRHRHADLLPLRQQPQERRAVGPRRRRLLRVCHRRRRRRPQSLQRLLQPPFLHRLEQVIEGLLPEGGHGKVGVPGDEDDAGRPRPLLQPLRHLQPVQPRHPDVHKQHVVGQCPDQLQRLPAVGRLAHHHDVGEALQRQPELQPGRRLVVDNQGL